MDDEDIRTIWCGNLSEKVTEDILYELFLQGGPVQKVCIPKDRDGGRQKSFGFVTYKHVCSVPYALELFEGTKLFNRPLNMKSRNNTLDANNQMQKMQQQLHQQMQQQMQHHQQNNVFNNRQHDLRNSLLLGQQVLSGMFSSSSLAANPMSMLPNMSYPSQNSMYNQSPKSLDHRNNRHKNNHHPYQDMKNYNDRRNHRQDSYNRDNKNSSKSSSYRSRDHHESRRKHR